MRRPEHGPDAHAEHPLQGGNAGGAVVRVGSTVRKAWTEATPAVHAFLAALRQQGLDVPRPLGRDEQGRQVLEHVPGDLALTAPRLTRAELARVGTLVRGIHDAAEHVSLDPDAHWDPAIEAPGAELVCHQDLAPWNLVLGPQRWVFIDWDGSGPSTRLWDLAYSAQAFTLNHPARVVEDSAADLAAFLEGYGASADLREALPAAMERRTAAMLDLLETSHARGHEPWSTMYVEGHGAHWSSALAYVRDHRAAWARAISPGSSPDDGR